MNATMIKGERSKLLAVVAIMAMVVCAFAAFVPAVDAADDVTVANDVPAADDNGIIKLTSDVTYTANTAEAEEGMEDVWRVNEAATLDLNGFTLSLQCIDINLTDNTGTFEIIDSVGTGKIVKNDGVDTSALLQVQNGTLEMTGGTVEAVSETGGWYGIYVMTSSTAILDGTTVTAGTSAICGNGTQSNATMVLKNVTATSKGSAAVFFPSTETLDIDGGVYTGTNGIEVRAGTVTIDGATINATGSVDNEKIENDGPLAYGMAVAVIDHASYAIGSEISVSIGSDVVLNGNSYDVYIGNINGTDTNTGKFNTTNLGEKYTFAHAIDFTMPGYSAEFTAGEGYRFAATGVTTTSFTVPAGIVVGGTVSFEEGVSVTISNVKAAGEDGLTISQGSVVLTGEMTAAAANNQINIAIAAGETEIELGDLTITGGTLAPTGNVLITGDVKIDDGAKLDLSKSDVTVKSGSSLVASEVIIDQDNFTAESGAVINTVFKASSGTGTKVIHPYYDDGAIVTITNASGSTVEYTVFHADTQAGEVQFGVAASLTYNGLNQAGEIRNVAVVSLDNDYPNTSGQPKAYVYNPGVYDPEDPQAKDPATMTVTEFGICKDVVPGGYGLYISFTMNNTAQTVNVEAGVTIMMYPGEPDGSVTIDDMIFGDTDNAPVISYEDFDSDTTLDSYIEAIGEKQVTITITGENLAEPIILSYPFDDAGEQLSKLTPGEYDYVAFFPAKNANYNDFTTKSKTFGVQNAIPGITVGVPEQNDSYQDYNVPYGEIVSYDEKTAYDVGYSTVENVDKILVSGGMYWINDLTAFADANIPSWMSPGYIQGYYLVMEISAEQDFGFTWQFSDGSPNTVAAGESGYVFKWLGKDISAIRATNDLKLTITPDEDSGYGAVEYALDLSGVKRMTTAGYAAEKADAVAGLQAEGVNSASIVESNISPETMWMVFDLNGYTGDISLALEFMDGTTIYGQKATVSKDVIAWFFSFDSSIESGYIGNPETDGYIAAYADYKEKYGDAAPGSYILSVADADGKAITSIEQVIEGVADSDFGYFAEQAESGMSVLRPDYKPTDVSDRTMWLTWYQGQHYDNITITVSKNDTQLGTYTESADLDGNPYNFDKGYHTWYASFDLESQLGELFGADPIGTYTVTVTSGTHTIATGEIQVGQNISEFDVTESVQDPVLDKDLADIQFVKITSTTGGYLVEGELVYIAAGDFPGYQTNSPAGYYLAVTVSLPGELTWADFPHFEITIGTVTITADDLASYPGEPGKWDGTHVFYLGATLPTEETSLSIAVDLDGENGDYFTETTKTLKFDVTKLEYTIVLKDAFNDDLTYDAPESGKFQLPYGAGPGFLYWIDENGKIRNGGSTFNINGSMDADPKDGVITLTAVYAGVSEHTIQYWIGAAPEYVYPAGYTYNGWYDIDGTTVYAVYSVDEYTAGTPMMYDFARYLGALYYASEGDIVSIYVNGELYTWDADGPQIGSNWYNADGETLVSVITGLFLNADGYAKNGVTMELTNQAGDRVAMNYYLAVESEGTGSGDVGYDLVRQLGDYYLDVVLNDDNTVTVSLKVNADKIEGYANVLSAVQFTVFDWKTYKNVSFDDYLGVVFIDEPSADGTVASIVIDYNTNYQVTVSGLVTLTVPIDTEDLSTLDAGSTTQDESATKTE